MSDSPVMDKTLAHLVSFVQEQYPESRPLSSPPLAPLCRFGASLPGLPLESSLVNVSASLPRLLQFRVLVRQGGGGGGCAASGSPTGVPALYDFRCSQGVSLLVRLYRVLLSLLSFLWLLGLLFHCPELGNCGSLYLAVRLRRP